MVCTYKQHMYIHVHVIQGFIQDFELGGGLGLGLGLTLLNPPTPQGLGLVVCYSQDGRTIPDHIPDECDMVFVCEQFEGEVYDYLHSRKFRCVVSRY